MINSVNALHRALSKNKLLPLTYLKRALYGVFFISGIFSELSLALTPLPQNCPTLSQVTSTNLVRSSRVKWIVDGDTIHTINGDKIRLLYINTPELNTKDKNKATPFSKAAQSYLATLIGKSGKLFWHLDTQRKDKYGRQLAVAFNENGIFLNAKIVQQGLGQAFIILPNQKYWQCIASAEKQAQKAQKNLWSRPHYNPISAKYVMPDKNLQLIRGHVTQIKNTRNNRWLILNNRLWLGIPKKNFNYFKPNQISYKAGDTISLKGFVYYSHKKQKVKLFHPAMLLP